jgi:hypothetical protein
MSEKAIVSLLKLLEDFEMIMKEGDYHARSERYETLLQEMERVALKIEDREIERLEKENPDLAKLVRVLRIKSNWPTFYKPGYT